VLPTPTLRLDRLTLRPVEETDADDLFTLMSDAHVLRYWDSSPWTDPERARAFVARSHRMAEEDSGARLVVERAADGAFLGWITFTSWDPDLHSAELGYVLTRQAWGHGYATEAARAVLTWAYDALPLNRVQSEADTRNPASARVLEKLGFVLEGTLREDCVVDGVVSDSWVYGLLRRDWERQDAQASSVSTSTS
jgi:ribosomal-protein-alanine N-acetyltransferase